MLIPSRARATVHLLRCTVELLCTRTMYYVHVLSTRSNERCLKKWRSLRTFMYHIFTNVSVPDTCFSPLLLSSLSFATHELTSSHSNHYCQHLPHSPHPHCRQASASGRTNINTQQTHQTHATGAPRGRIGPTTTGAAKWRCV